MNAFEKFREYRKEYEPVALRSQILDAEANTIELYLEGLLQGPEAQELIRRLSDIRNQNELSIFAQQMDELGVSALQRLERSDENSLALQKLREIFQDSIQKINASSWQNIIRNFLQKADLKHADSFQELLVRSWLARFLEKAYYASHEQGIDALQFGEHITEAINAVDILPNFLLKDGETIDGKRQPSFLESIEATLERFSVV